MAIGQVVGQGGLKPTDKALLIPSNIRAGVTIDGITGDVNVVDTSAGNANNSVLLTGYKAYVDGALVTGSMANQGTKTYIPGISNQTIPAGYHNGSGYVAGSPSLVSANIKKGQTIFGITGSASVVETSDANAASSHIYSGKTAYVNGTKLTGTMPVYGSTYTED